MKLKAEQKQDIFIKIVIFIVHTLLVALYTYKMHQLDLCKVNVYLTFFVLLGNIYVISLVFYGIFKGESYEHNFYTLVTTQLYIIPIFIVEAISPIIEISQLIKTCTILTISIFAIVIMVKYLTTDDV